MANRKQFIFDNNLIKTESARLIIKKKYLENTISDVSGPDGTHSFLILISFVEFFLKLLGSL